MHNRLFIAMLICGGSIHFSSCTLAFGLDEGFSGTGPFSVLNPTTSPPEAIGDYNGDRINNLADYTVWRDSFGATGPDLAADGDDGTGTGVPDEIVDQSDYTFWKNNFGSSGFLSGFDEDGWLYSGTTWNQIGHFDSGGGTFVISRDQSVPFVLNNGSVDIYQAISGVLQPTLPIGGRIEYLVEYEDFELATPSTDPDALNGVTINNQHIVTQMNFGNVNLNPGPLNVEFLDMQMIYDSAADTYTLSVSPLLDNAVVANGSIDLRAAGFLAPEEDLTALDLKVTIDSDTVNGGSTILVEFQINNSGTFEDFYNLVFGTAPGVGIDGIDYPVDLATDGTSVSVNQVMLANLFVNPGQPGAPSNPQAGDPHPFIVSPGLSIDRTTFTSPDVVSEGLRASAQVPEPRSLALAILLVVGWAFRISRLTCR